MRHFIANITVAVIALLLISLACTWALVRSGQLILTTEKEFEMQRFIAAGADLSNEEWLEIGEAVYIRNCAACHAQAATGQSNYYPALWNQDRVLEAENGREYVIQTIIYGSATGLYSAPMPPLGNLSDLQISAALNYVLHTFSEAPVDFITTDEVSAQRDLQLREREVGRTRPDVPSPFELSGSR